MKGRIAAIVIAGLVAVGAATAVATPASAEAVGCRVDYSSSNFSGGFLIVDMTVTNLGAPLTGWQLAFDFTAGQRVGNGFNALWSQTGGHVTATNLAYNASLGTGNSLTNLGFYGSWTGSNPPPASFTLNGVVCDGTVTNR